MPRWSILLKVYTLICKYSICTLQTNSFMILLFFSGYFIYDILDMLWCQRSRQTLELLVHHLVVSPKFYILSPISYWQPILSSGMSLAYQVEGLNCGTST